MKVPILEELLNRTYQDASEITAGHADWDTLDMLEAKKYLTPIGTLEMISCPTCHNTGDIGWMNIKGRGNVPFASCVECGIYEVDPRRLRYWKIRLEAILERLVETLELRGGIQVHVPNLLWRLGRKKNREYLYIRRYNRKEQRMIRNELSQMPRAILMTGTQLILEDIRCDHDHASFSLDRVAALDEQGELLIDFEVLQDILGDDEPEKIVPQSAPRRGSLEIKIKKLCHELERFLKDAKEHARITGEQGQIDFLPCPTMEELAKRTKMNKMDVSRCLKNSKNPLAKHLRLLWETANNLRDL
jgi:hypothetical protein